MPALLKKMACIIDPYPKQQDSSQSPSNSPSALLLQPPQLSSLTNVTTSSVGSRSGIDIEAVQRRLDERIRVGKVESYYAIAIGREPGIYISL